MAEILLQNERYTTLDWSIDEKQEYTTSDWSLNEKLDKLLSLTPIYTQIQPSVHIIFTLTCNYKNNSSLMNGETVCLVHLTNQDDFKWGNINMLLQKSYTKPIWLPCLTHTKWPKFSQAKWVSTQYP